MAAVRSLAGKGLRLYVYPTNRPPGPFLPWWVQAVSRTSQAAFVRASDGMLRDGDSAPYVRFLTTEKRAGGLVPARIGVGPALGGYIARSDLSP